MKISKRERIMVLVMLVFVVGVIIWVVQAPPPVTVARGPLLPLDQAEQKRAVALRTLKQMSSDQDEMEPRLAATTYDLSAEQLEPRVIRDLQRIAARAGVHLREIKPLRPRAFLSAPGVRVPLEVRFRAAFQPNVVRFLYYVEDPTDKMVVDKLNLTSADARFKTVDVSAQITVFTRSLEGSTNTDSGETSDAAKTNKS